MRLSALVVLVRRGLATLAVLAARAAPALGQATACDPSTMDPFPPLAAEPLLDRYYVATDGVGGLGCWVHRHPNGRDLLVTPYGWGRRPDPDRRVFIDAVFEAITASRRTYERLGDLDVDLAFLLSDVHRGEQETYWLVDGQCWMEGAAEEVWGGLDGFRQVVAHEIGHCLLMQDGLWTPSTYQGGVQKWLDEAAAEFLSSEVYPATNREYGYVYDVGSPIPQPYRAHALLRQYTNKHDVGATMAFVRALAPARSPSHQWELLRGAGYTAEEFLEALMKHRYSGIRDPGGGTLPNGSLGEWVPNLLLDESSDEAALPPIDGLLLTMLDVIVPAGFNARLSAPEGGSHEIAAVVDFGPLVPPEPLGSGIDV